MILLRKGRESTKGGGASGSAPRTVRPEGAGLAVDNRLQEQVGRHFGRDVDAELGQHLAHAKRRHEACACLIVVVQRAEDLEVGFRGNGRVAVLFAELLYKRVPDCRRDR